MKKKIKKIGIICDLLPDSGLGHIRRMRYLATELERKKAKCYFIFNKKHEKFIRDFTKDIPVIFFREEGKNKYERAVEIATKIGISIIIFDSYKLEVRWEKEFIYKGFFVVAIDDHLKKHYANLVITNKPKTQVPRENSIKQTWFMGPKYVLVKKNTKKITTKENNKVYRKILLHAGGSSLYNLIEQFTISAFKACKKFKAKIFVLCSTLRSEKIIKKIVNNLEVYSEVNLIPYTKNFESTFGQYDIIAGPSGTTTFETVLAGSLSFSIQLKDDNMDSLESWHSIGHLMHLNYDEKNNQDILDSSWKLIFEKYSELKKILKENSKNIDGKGPLRIAKIILEHAKKPATRGKISFNKKSYNNKLVSVRCTLEDTRKFLNARNHIKVRSVSTDPSHTISWPEHINWWINKDIMKFSIKYKEQVLAYHWIKLNLDSYGKFLTSGWFLLDDTKDNFKIAFSVLKFQIHAAKRKYKDLTWIIIMKKENKFVKALNAKMGFSEPTKKTIERALKVFSISKDDYIIMEMCL